MLREFQEEIMKLKAELNRMGGSGSNVSNPMSSEMHHGGNPQVVYQKNEEEMRELEQKLKLEKEEIKMKADVERRKIESQKQMAEQDKAKLLQKIKEKEEDRKSTRLNQSHSDLVCRLLLEKKKKKI